MIRRLGAADVEQAFPLRLEALKNEPTAFGGSFEEEFAEGPARLAALLETGDDNNAVFGAFVEDKLVGTIGVYAEKSLRSKHKSTIWGMYVRREQRGKGIGKELVFKAIEHAKRKMTVRTVYLTVESRNKTAKNLYLSCGFTVWGREPGPMSLNGAFLDADQITCSCISTRRRSPHRLQARLALQSF